MSPWLSVVIPTAGLRHDGLLRTIDSVRLQSDAEHVEVVVVGDTNGMTDSVAMDILRDQIAAYRNGCRWLELDAGVHCYGQPQRSFGARRAHGEWVAFSQDDNILDRDAVESIWSQVSQQPHKRPLFFKVLTPWRAVVWSQPRLQLADIDADCLVLPAELASVVDWGLRYEGDFDAAVHAFNLSGGDVSWCEAQIAIARPDREHLWW